MNKQNENEEPITLDISYEVNYDDIVDKEDSDISLLDTKYKVVANDINVLKNGGKELQEKLNEAVIDATGLVAFQTGQAVSSISLISTLNPKLQIYTTDYNDQYFLEIEDHETRIETNEQNIETLNAIVQESFNSFGVYETETGTLTKDFNTPYRPNLTEIRQLNPDYIQVQLEPNLFTNTTSGNATFTLNLSDIVNDDVDKTISILIYKNNELVEQIDQDIVAGASGHQLLSGNVNFEANDQVYFEYDITAGTGSITSNTAPKINIEVRGLSVEGAKASTTIDDVDTAGNQGLVPRFKDTDSKIETNATSIVNNTNAINANTASIATNRTDINTHTTQIDKINVETILFENLNGQQANIPAGYVNLTESIYNFREIIITGFIDASSYRDKTFVLNIPTSIISINIETDDLNKRNRKFILQITGGGDQLEIQFNSTNQLQTTWYNQERITRVIGKGRK